MKSTTLRVLFAALIALGFFALGYLAPHHQTALAQAPSPTPSVYFDNVPGGVGGHGNAEITEATTTLVNGQPVSAWPCRKHYYCTITFDLRFVPLGGMPGPVSCPSGVKHCMIFSGDEWTVYKQDAAGAQETPVSASVSGVIALTEQRK
jgi:hypothetical protein